MPPLFVRMESRGGVTGGASIDDFLQGYAQAGYADSFHVRPDGTLLCASCQRTVQAERVKLRSMRRVEGVSDPADMGAIAALECPECGARGTATFCVGATCPPEHGRILRALDNQRPSAQEAWSAANADQSLVRDTGWLRGPDDRDR